MMATYTSKEVSPNSEKTGMEYFWESRVTISDILELFRQCHDVCVQSRLFQDETILQIDQCGVDFRQLSLDMATVAKKTSNMWLDVAIAFFENIDDVEDPKDMLQLLGSQARELAMYFKTISACARDLYERINTSFSTQVDEEFKRIFKVAQERAECVREEIQAKFEEAVKLRKKAATVRSEYNWHIPIVHVTLSWIPAKSPCTPHTGSITSRKTAELRKLKDRAHEELDMTREREDRTRELLAVATADVTQCVGRNGKAQEVADNIGKLVEVLTNLEGRCEAMATCWTIEADDFDDQVSKIGQSVATKRQAKDRIESWTKAKQALDRYASAVSMINNRFNFATEARPSSVQQFHFTTLDLVLKVPTSVHVNID